MNLKTKAPIGTAVVLALSAALLPACQQMKQLVDELQPLLGPPSDTQVAGNNGPSGSQSGSGGQSANGGQATGGGQPSGGQTGGGGQPSGGQPSDSGGQTTGGGSSSSPGHLTINPGVIQRPGLHAPFIYTVASNALISCAPATGGDVISRAFYVTQYPGVNFTQVQLYLSANVAGTYRVSLTARQNAFNGPVLGTSTATVTLSGNVRTNAPATFSFASPAVTKGGTVAFQIQLVGGPAGGQAYFAMTTATSCPVTETEDASAPLSKVRRTGIGVVIQGAAS